MAPTLGDDVVVAQPSSPLNNTTFVISVAVVISSVVGASAVVAVILIAISIRRRILANAARLAAETEQEFLPTLVITDTSIHPAPSIVVDDGDVLEKVIASHKPIAFADSIEHDSLPPIHEDTEELNYEEMAEFIVELPKDIATPDQQECQPSLQNQVSLLYVCIAFHIADKMHSRAVVLSPRNRLVTA